MGNVKMARESRYIAEQRRACGAGAWRPRRTLALPKTLRAACVTVIVITRFDLHSSWQ